IELWKFDPRSGDAAVVADIVPGPDGSGVSQLTNVNGRLFFVADDGSHGAELWQSDGTAAGTMLVKDIVPGPQSSLTVIDIVNQLTPVITQLFLVADTWPALWRSDGTATGTVPITSSFFSDTNNLASVNGRLLFSTDEGIWKSDGTDGGTVFLQN